MSDTLEIFGQEWTGVTGIKATDDNDTIKTFIRPQGTVSITANGQGIDVSQYASADVAVPSTDFIITVSYNSTTQRWEPDCTFAEVQTAYNAGKTIAVVSSEQSGDSAVDGEYHTGTNPYFEYWVRKYMDGYSPQTIRETGYHLTSTGINTEDDINYIRPTGTINISQSGNTDVNNYATANVPAGALDDILEYGVENDITISVSNSGLITASVDMETSASPVITSGYINSNSSMPVNVEGSKTQQLTTQAAQTIHPSTSDQTISSGRYLTGTQTIKAVTTTNLTAENIKSGVVVQIGDSTDADCVKSVTGTYEGGGGTSKNAQAVTSTTRVTSTSLTACSGTITVAKTGTYDVYWSTHRTSTSGSWSSRLYINGTASGTEQTSGWSNHVQPIHLTGVSLTAGQTIRVYAKSRGSNYYAYVPLLTIIES